MIALLLATLLRFTTPAFDAVAPNSCEPDTLPCRDLALVRLYGQPQGELLRLLGEHVATVPGVPDSFDIELDWRPWSLWAVAVDSAGNESCRGTPLQINGGLGVDPATAGFWLGAPRPNPASGLVAVPFCLPEAGTASLEVFDVQGRRRMRLVSGNVVGGIHVAVWSATQERPGIYLLWLKFDGHLQSRRLVVLR